jgi:hypothetical protein
MQAAVDGMAGTMHEGLRESGGLDHGSSRPICLVARDRLPFCCSAPKRFDGGVPRPPDGSPYLTDAGRHLASGKADPGLIGEHGIPASAGPEIQEHEVTLL